MSFVKLLVSVPDSSTTMKSILGINTAANQFSTPYLEKFVTDLIDGAQLGFVKLSTGAVQATGTVTLSSIVATDTVTVNGRIYTGSDTPSGAQQFLTGSTDTASAASLAAKINADTSTTVAGVVSATSALGVVTITAVQPGLTGNAITIAISAHGSVSGSGRLTSGSDGSQVTANFGRPS